ncbi:MAG: RNA polymerase sigma factor [Clostridia bacterium]|nr:RNA polymerase sigma factor [Clostridia bacterium]
MQEKLNALIARQGDRVYRMAYSICPNEADDVWQEVFLKWLRAQPEFPDEARERAWLLKVTANLCRSRLRSPWYKRREELSEAFPAPDGTGETLRELIDRLPKDLRAAVYLHYYEGYSTKECAELLGIRESALRMRLHRARALLKNWIEEDET